MPSDVKPVPATGPYMVASAEPGHRYVLTRNPHFREWSQAAQPDGYPDRIELRLDVPKSRQIDAVLRGEADAIPDGVPPGRLRELRTQHAARTHVEPEPSDVMVILNTRVPPFDDVRVRRALNVRDRPPGGGARERRARGRRADMPDPAAQLPRLRALLPVRRSGPSARTAAGRGVRHARACAWC